MSSDVEFKQQYLRQQILDQNYDPGDFADYCIETVGNVDIDSWTFEDLERIVTFYIEKQSNIHHSHRISFSNTQQDMNPTTQQVVYDRPQQTYEPPVSAQDYTIPTIIPTTQLFRQQDLNNLFSATFTSNTAKTQSSPSFSAWGTNIKSNPSPKPDALKFDEIFSNIQGGSGSATNVFHPKPTVYSPPAGNMNIFDMDLDKNQGNQYKAQLSSKGFEEAVLKKSKQEATKPPKTQQKTLERRQSKIEVIKCFKAGLRQLLNKQKIQIQIKGHEIVNRNFFVPDYVLYHVYTKGIQVEVNRKYDHFQRLRAILAKFYPCCRLPYLQKNTWLSQTDVQNIKKQKVMLQYFMNDLIMNSELRNSRILQDFLTITEHTKLKSVLTEYEQMAKLRGIEELCLLSSEVKVSFGDTAKAYFDRMSPYLQELQQNMTKFLKLSDQAFANYATLLKSLTDITELLSTMRVNTKQVCEEVPTAEFSDLEESLLSISQIYNELCNNVKFDMKIMENYSKPIFRFERQNLTTINEINDIRIKFNDIFYKSGGDSKAQCYVGNKGIELYKIGIDEPSKNSTVLKYQVGFYNKASMDQANKMLKDLSFKLDARFGNIAHQYRQRYTQQLLFWLQVIPLESQPA